MRETTAALLLYLSDWSPTEDLCDPMCGSGTIAVEAALMTSGCSPGLIRYGGGVKRPSATRWGDLESPEAHWEDELNNARRLDRRKEMSSAGVPRIHINDIHPGK